MMGIVGCVECGIGCPIEGMTYMCPVVEPKPCADIVCSGHRLFHDTRKHGGIGLVRNEVLAFSLMMEKVLQQNDFKRGWHDMSIGEIMNRIYDEVRELNTARKALEKSVERFGHVSIHELEAVKKEAIDLANFCMFMVDVL